MKSLFLTLAAIAATLCAGCHTINGAEVTLAWDAHPDPSVDSFRVHYGPAPGTYTESVAVGKVTKHTLQLPTGTHYFIVTAVAGGLESPPSNEVVSTMLPAAPTGLRVTIVIMDDGSVVVEDLQPFPAPEPAPPTD